MVSDSSLWSERQRLRFVESLLFWKGTINRKDLCRHFGISLPQATNDLVNYTTRNPGACSYNVRSRRYEANPGMKPVLIEPDFGREVGEWGGSLFPEGVEMFVAEPEKPVRAASTSIFQAFSRAAHQREWVEIRYWSLGKGTEEWRKVSPRTFACDGLRWHARAFCHQNQRFQDFNLSRVERVRGSGPCSFREEVDEDWHRHTAVTIGPAPMLNASQRKAMELDYGMRRGKVRFEVRRALLIYSLRRLGFIEPDLKKLPVLNELKELQLLKVG